MLKNARSNATARTSPRTPLATAALAILVTAACVDDPTTAPDASGRNGAADGSDSTVLGLVEVTITGVGTGGMSATARAYPAAGHDARFAVTGVGNGDGSGDGTIQLEPVSTGSFTDGERGADGTRYLRAIFRVRNAQEDGTAYDSPRENLTFLAVDTDASLNETAVTALDRFDGSPAADAETLALDVQPTGAVKRTADGTIESEHADVLQVLTEDEAADILAEAPEDVNTVFPYGFVVRDPDDPSGRTLPANPAPDQFDGVVTFAFKLPLRTTSADDPFEVRAVFLAVDDSETRLTESPQERTAAGETALQARADELAAGGTPVTVTLLADRADVIDGHDLRRICSVRTAGIDPENPLAVLDDPADCTPCEEVPTILHVDVDAAPGGDGASWGTAFASLQDALDYVREQADAHWACGSVHEIWVADGVYYPDEGGGVADDDDAATFALVEDVEIYGGFSGGETMRDERDPDANVTVLSGDIGQDDLNGDGDFIAESPDDVQGTNSAQVVTAEETDGTKITRATVLDGFTITAGGGLHCIASTTGAECSPTLRRLTFSGNVDRALTIHASGASATPLIEDARFTGNAVTGSGGAVMVSSANASLAAPAFVRVTFADNESSAWGGAVALISSSGGTDVEFYNATFRDNFAPTGGGAVYTSLSSIRVVNSVVQANQTDGYGGAMIFGQAATRQLINVTVEGNTAGEAGGAFHTNGPDVILDLSNVVVWGNAPDGIGDFIFLTSSSAEHSIIQGGCPSPFSCSDVLDQDPLFVDAAAGNLRLQVGSPAIDTGTGVESTLPRDRHDLDGDGDTNEYLPVDLDDNPRVVDATGLGTAIVDMGAYEKQP